VLPVKNQRLSKLPPDLCKSKRNETVDNRTSIQLVKIFEQEKDKTNPQVLKYRKEIRLRVKILNEPSRAPNEP
jgi:hypothetical protein